MRTTLTLISCLLLSVSIGSAQERRNIMYEKPAGSGPTYGQIVEKFFEATVFPAGMDYKGVSIKRDNVIAERVETNGRGGYWFTVRARYSGSVFGVGVAERARITYDNGGITVDLGGLKGVLNTRSIGRWIREQLPDNPAPPVPPKPQDRMIEYSIKNETKYTITLEFTPSNNTAKLAPGQSTNCKSPVKDGQFPKVKAKAPNGSWWERTIRNDNGKYQIINHENTKVKIVP